MFDKLVKCSLKARNWPLWIHVVTRYLGKALVPSYDFFLQLTSQHNTVDLLISSILLPRTNKIDQFNVLPPSTFLIDVSNQDEIKSLGTCTSCWSDTSGTKLVVVNPYGNLVPRHVGLIRGSHMADFLQLCTASFLVKEPLPLLEKIIWSDPSFRINLESLGISMTTELLLFSNVRRDVSSSRLSTWTVLLFSLMDALEMNPKRLVHCTMWIKVTGKQTNKKHSGIGRCYVALSRG